MLAATVVLLAGGLTLTACSGGGAPLPPIVPPAHSGDGTPWPTGQQGGTPTQPQQPTSTSTATATCTSTATSTSRSLTEWETLYGQAVANAAHELLSNADDYYIWGADTHPDDEDAGWPPPREGSSTWGFNGSIDIKERTGDRTPIVCADVADLSYKSGGLDLETSFPNWYNNFDNPPTRHVGSLQKLVNEKGKLHQWGDGYPVELGDMIFFSDSSHMGIVAEIQGDGTDPTMVFVVQASYSLGVINKMPLDKWQTGHDPASFGHPEPNK